MTTQARIGMGAEFWLEDDTTPTPILTRLAEILGVPMPDEQVEEVEATHMDSGRYREWIAGLIDSGEGTFDMNLVPGSPSDDLLQTAKSDGITRAYKIILPDGATGWEITGDCWVKGYARQVPIDDRMTVTVTVRFTGTTTEGTS